MSLEKNERIFFSLLSLLLAIAYFILGHKSYVFNSFDFIKILTFSLTLLQLPLIGACLLMVALSILGFLIPSSSIFSIIIFILTLYGPYKFLLDVLSNKRWPLYFLLLIPLLGFSAFALWHRGYLSPFFFEKILQDLNAADSYNHLAISHLIKERNFLSIGIDGLQYQQYHYGSHILFAYISKVFNIHILPFYCLVLPIAFVPLLFSTIFQVSNNFFARLPKEKKFENYKFICFLILVVGVAPLFLRAKIGFWQSAYVSESYMVSLVFALPWFYLAILKPYPVLKDWLMVLLLTLVIGYTKVSTLFVLIVFLGIYLLLTKKLWRINTGLGYLALFILSTFLFFKLMPTGNYKSDGSSVELFSFYKRYIDLKYLPLHFVLFYLPTWMIYFYEGENKKILQKTFLLTLIISTVPGLFINIPGGSAYYFLDVINWLALPLALESFRNQKLQNLINKKVLAVICILAIFPIFKATKKLTPLNNLFSNAYFLNESDMPKRELLQKIYGIKSDEFKDAFVFIPRGHLYWSLLTCEKSPLLFQALTGLPQLNAQPAATCVAAQGLYGYENYNAPLAEVADFNICLKHPDKRVFMLDSNAQLLLLCKPNLNSRE